MYYIFARPRVGPDTGVNDAELMNVICHVPRVVLVKLLTVLRIAFSESTQSHGPIM
ncbi:hypothetical protein TOT_020000886 [Theileria orientalis strain Shintoku]|uniref:Uncharacterized protein n=1 Tax=Theileria orientalis strain Shintoku TaxID=869250 RepID=J4CD71_THEOR|nr:hypothetical protein TOT_020000886 [Theileria orientalis strain Shintoku]PVC54494.1 hypothetical protein MACL_00003039 [Theileria orientalis]BAM40632.1 hypothetical protein TOT_020000886 [Theileria orientalis strain Shintoku]|eukprot:XP_009690933.1 hypothetical protein TOT_020000886 [Theileria orientalis strain Shintoku]